MKFLFVFFIGLSAAHAENVLKIKKAEIHVKDMNSIGFIFGFSGDREAQIVLSTEEQIIRIPVILNMKEIGLQAGVMSGDYTRPTGYINPDGDSRATLQNTNGFSVSDLLTTYKGYQRGLAVSVPAIHPDLGMLVKGSARTIKAKSDKGISLDMITHGGGGFAVNLSSRVWLSLRQDPRYAEKTNLLLGKKLQLADSVISTRRPAVMKEWLDVSCEANRVAVAFRVDPVWVLPTALVWDKRAWSLGHYYHPVDVSFNESDSRIKIINADSQTKGSWLNLEVNVSQLSETFHERDTFKRQPYYTPTSAKMTILNKNPHKSIMNASAKCIINVHDRDFAGGIRPNNDMNVLLSDLNRLSLIQDRY